MTQVTLGNWITAPKEFEDIVPIFRHTFSLNKEAVSAIWRITALGMYIPSLNRNKITDAVFLPGWTDYRKRVQFQEYDITDQLQPENTVEIKLGKGWYASPLAWENSGHRYGERTALCSCIEITYNDGSSELFTSDTDWQVSRTGILFSEIYAGETFDSTPVAEQWQAAERMPAPDICIIPQEGELVKEQERFPVKEIILTPKGETVLDFGQNMTGYVEVKLRGPRGHEVIISHAEVLDANGDFYTENLRSAKQQNRILCNGDTVSFKPCFTFQGFRYVRLENWPEEVKAENFTAVTVYSDMKRTGHFNCSHQKLNQLYQNALWGQRSNFVDVPTDCPQRDERLGWTADAQVFLRAAAYNYDVERFFIKWLHDLRECQFDDGEVPAVIPDVLGREGAGSAAWGDAAVICPWRLYLNYGNRQILEEQFPSMKKWVDYIRAQGEKEELWNTGIHYGDWLGLDAPYGSYKGATWESLIATAFFAYSTSILCKAGYVLEMDMSEYEQLHQRIRSAYIQEYLPQGRLLCDTQTAHVLTLYFDLCDNKELITQRLAQLIHDNGDRLQTGFVGTPYLLHVLSENGYIELAYTLLMQEQYPSWLYPINQGATTIWEHWDGIKPDGTMWSPNMNSYNHYAYGAVVDWMYGVICGINPSEDEVGYKHIMIRPLIDQRLDYAEASLDTKFGKIISSWKNIDAVIEYNITIPDGCTATIDIDGDVSEVGGGKHIFKRNK